MMAIPLPDRSAVRFRLKQDSVTCRSEKDGDQHLDSDGGRRTGQ